MARSCKDGRHGGAHRDHFHGVAGKGWDWFCTPASRKFQKRRTVREARRNCQAELRRALVEVENDFFETLLELHDVLDESDFNYHQEQEYEMFLEAERERETFIDDTWFYEPNWGLDDLEFDDHW